MDIACWGKLDLMHANIDGFPTRLDTLISSVISSGVVKLLPLFDTTACTSTGS